MTRVLAVIATMATGLGPAGATRPPAFSAALVIGHNGSSQPKVEPLRYADDDAVRNAELMRELGAHTELLVELDRDSRSLFPMLEARAPTMDNLTTAVSRVNLALRAAKQAGNQTTFFLFYSGHGDIEHGEGFLELADTRLFRQRLRETIESVRADTVHVVLDACKSYFALFGRGKGGQRRTLSQQLVTSSKPLPANVGVLLSTSAAQDSHEWEAFQGGVFSHEVRSALRGAADLNADGTVSYDETGAFIFAANKAIPNPRYRPAFFVAPPLSGGSGASLVTLPAAPMASELLVEQGLVEHFFVEDERGLRILDSHADQDLALRLLVPAKRPLFVHVPRARLEYTAAEPGPIHLASLAPTVPTSSPRGARHVAFASLFDQPFGSSSLRDYHLDAALRVFSPPQTADGPPPWLRATLGWTSLGSGLGAAALAGAALYQRGQIRPSSPNADRLDANRRIEGYNAVAVPLVAVAATSLVTYLWSVYATEKTVDED